MDKLMWYECDWKNTSSEGRPTENKAFRNIKLQSRFFMNIKKNKGLNHFYKKVAAMELSVMSTGADQKVAVTKISQRFGISEIKVQKILSFCTILAYFEEINT